MKICFLNGIYVKMSKNIYKLKHGLVSIIVPCYNGACFLPRLLDSICKQTYTYIQLIFVNDGSLDETEQIFCSYIPLFCSIGIRYIYIKQGNQGQAAAINAAFPYVEGEYIMWVDADDYLAETHMREKVKCLNEHNNVSIVCCKGIIVEENNIERVAGYLDNQHITGNLFENLLFERARCTPGLYMVRTKDLFDVLPNKRIYPSRVGQNFQMLLPISYKNKIHYINEFLFYYVVRNDSHSHSIHGISQWCKRLHAIKELKLHILQEMEQKLPVEYMRLLSRLVCVQELYQKINMILSAEYKDKDSICIKEEMEKLYGHFSSFGKERQFWIWGYCSKNCRLKQYIERYTKATVTGFVDSDRTKWDEINVISPESINSDNMYLIIPLREHSDISNWLHLCGFQINRDVFYPEFEISESLKNYWMHHERS